MTEGSGIQSFAKDNHFFALDTRYNHLDTTTSFFLDTRYSASLTTGSQLIGHPGAQQRLGTAGWISEDPLHRTESKVTRQAGSHSSDKLLPVMLLGCVGPS